ncbi:hypothetical protein CASFOL_013339 [Castilleja foliolosa]|uniref:Membrane-associated kinase regulator 4 n=1 Tax=Castilleja foliolosa TaxID=1961234 RepID=A0ABD3DKZ4_9LAMI
MYTITNISPQHEHEQQEEGYINMELSSRNSSSSSSSPQTKDFEFQILSLTPNNIKEANYTPFPADDLFYKGKLLPLLLPSRRQMLRNLTVANFTKMPFHQHHNYHSMPSTHTLNTPSDSCNISPSESCRVSCELNPDDYFFEWSTELSGFVTTNNNNNKNNNNNHLIRKKVLSWPKKLKLGNKLKSSRAYLKSLFTSAKGNCSSGPNYEEIANGYKKNPTTIASIMKSVDYTDGIDYNAQRRSFSSAIKRRYPVKCLLSSSSSSSSNSSNGFHEPRRSISATENEGSIEAAIAHCKKSYGIAGQKRSGFCSI